VDAYQRSLQLTRNSMRSASQRGQTSLKPKRSSSPPGPGIDAGIQRAQLEHAIDSPLGKAARGFFGRRRSRDYRVSGDTAGLPSELLERRPDIAAAERRTAAANAQIASPAHSSLAQPFGHRCFQSSVLSQLFSLPSRYWSLGAALAQTIFDAGLRRAQTAQAIATYDEMSPTIGRRC